MYREKLGHEVWIDLHAMLHFGERLGPLLDILLQHYPCLSCRKHLVAHVATDMPAVGKDEEHWLVDLHNLVNQELGKEWKEYDYCVLYDQYEDRARRLRSLPSYRDRLVTLDRRFRRLTMGSIAPKN